jgi:hypothetical protein
MTSAFDKLRQNSSNSAEKLRQTLEGLNKPANNFNQNEENFWQLTLNAEKAGAAVIRFLPAPDGEISNFVRYFSHAFQGPTGLWYIENSLTTFDQPDPVSELNRKLWNTGDESKKQLVRERKRRTHYVANILVLKDPANPENNGKVFYFRFGPQILEKIKDASCVRDELDDRDKKGLLFDPFDLWSGANFKLRSKKKDRWPSFETSEFDTPGRLFPCDEHDDAEVKKSDAAMEEVWKQTRPLFKFIDPENKDFYKPYDRLKERLAKVLVEDIPAVANSKDETSFKEDDVMDSLDGDDEDLEMFKSLKGVEH